VDQPTTAPRKATAQQLTNQHQHPINKKPKKSNMRKQNQTPHNKIISISFFLFFV
tara:strand:- start:3788 stop:3952 length:165 start_codon:yes stop_codon:yes gene_type:complete